MQNIVSGVKKNGGVALKMGRGGAEGGGGYLIFIRHFLNVSKKSFTVVSYN